MARLQARHGIKLPEAEVAEGPASATTGSFASAEESQYLRL